MSLTYLDINGGNGCPGNNISESVDQAASCYSSPGPDCSGTTESAGAGSGHLGHTRPLPNWGDISDVQVHGRAIVPGELVPLTESLSINRVKSHQRWLWLDSRVPKIPGFCLKSHLTSSQHQSCPSCCRAETLDVQQQTLRSSYFIFTSISLDSITQPHTLFIFFRKLKLY